MWSNQTWIPSGVQTPDILLTNLVQMGGDAAVAANGIISLNLCLLTATHSAGTGWGVSVLSLDKYFSEEIFDIEEEIKVSL